MKNVDLIFDILDQAAMILYENLKINYLAALTEINKNLNDDEFNHKLDNETIEKLKFIYTPLIEKGFLNEEIRLALELYIVKGLRHINYPTNLMTPDFINYLFVIIINALFPNDNISVLDTNLGTGNLLATIKNNFNNDVNIVGIENDLNLVNFASAFMEIQHNEIKIYFQDALNKILDKVDVVIGDLANHYVEDGLGLQDNLYLNNIRYFPYLVIASRLENIHDEGYFIYLIDNDFFKKEDIKVFKKYFDQEANILGLILLPKSIFKDEHGGKSIIIGKKTNNKPLSRDMMAVEVKGLDSESLKQSINKIKLMVKKIKEE